MILSSSKLELNTPLCREPAYPIVDIGREKEQSKISKINLEEKKEPVVKLALKLGFWAIIALGSLGCVNQSWNHVTEISNELYDRLITWLNQKGKKKQEDVITSPKANSCSAPNQDGLINNVSRKIIFHPPEDLEKSSDQSRAEKERPLNIQPAKQVAVTSQITKQDSQTKDEKTWRLQIIQKKIARLDKDSPYFREDLINIKDEIRKIRSLPGSSLHTLVKLEKALNILQIEKPESLKISYEEMLFMEFLGKKYHIDERELRDDYPTSEQATIKKAQSALLKALKKAARNPNTIDAAAENAGKEAIALTRKERLRHFTNQHPLSPSLNHHFSSHYPKLIATYRKFSRNAIKKLEKCWSKIEKEWSKEEEKLYNKSEGRFSSILKTYSDHDPRKAFEEFREKFLSNFFQELDLSNINQMTSQQLEKELEKVVEENEKTAILLFKDNYRVNYIKIHDWLLNNLPHIREPYSQNDDESTNLGEGVCYNNCLDRISQFAKNPKLDPETIKMGSNNKTRYHQLRLKKLLETNSMTDHRAIQAKKVYGLALDHTHYIEEKDDVRNHLIDDIQTYSDKGYTQALLALRIPYKTGGHAIDLHFDKENGVYGFNDDNLGRVEFENLNVMRKQLELYLTHFYPDHTSLALEFYRIV